jgi:hypothetical protein
LTLIIGNPGEGKSYFSQAMVAKLTTGEPLPGDDSAMDPASVIILTAEDGLAETVRPRIEDMGGDLTRVHALKGFNDNNGNEKGFTLSDLDVLKSALEQTSAELVIVDPVIAYMDGKDTFKPEKVRQVLKPLVGVAESFNCAIVGIMHLNKTVARAIYRGQGSMDFVAQARSVFVVGTDPLNAKLRVLAHVKTNVGPKAPSLEFSIEELPDGNCCFKWGTETHWTADDVLGDGSNQILSPGIMLERAKWFLLGFLCNGAVDEKLVKEKANELKIAEATLRRAKQVLNIKSKKIGFGGAGTWVWQLPELEAVNDERLSALNGTEDVA